MARACRPFRAPIDGTDRGDRSRCSYSSSSSSSPSYSYSDLLSHDAVGRSRSRRLVPERREAAAPLRPRRTRPTHRDRFRRRPAVPPSFPSNGRVGSGDDGPAVRTGGRRRRRFRHRRRRIRDDRRTPAASSPTTAASSPTTAGRLLRPWRGGLDKAQHLSRPKFLVTRGAPPWRWVAENRRGGRICA